MNVLEPKAPHPNAAARRLSVSTFYHVGEDVLHGGEVWMLRGMDDAGGFVILARDERSVRVHASEIRGIGQPVRIKVNGE